MTDAQLALVLQYLPGILGAVFAGLSVLFAGYAGYKANLTSQQVDKNSAIVSAKTEELTKKQDENTAITVSTARTTAGLVHTSEEIAGKVDGHLSKLTEELASANTQIKESSERSKTLQDLVNQLIQATLTNGKSSHVAPISVAPATGDDATDSLKKIDVNTAAIEKNTARTEAGVQELKDKSGT